jgi:hypothetical protein
MKKLLLSAILIAIASATCIAGTTNSTGALLERYYAIKTALTRDNFDSARLASASFAQALSQVDAGSDGTLKDLTKKLVSSTKRMQSAKNIEEFRKAFKPASLAMISVATQYPSGDANKAYVQYCSMQKAYWLSPEQEIRNPYYGRKMLFCGQSMKTIE